MRLEGDIILDFRISWAMHADTPGDTIIFGTEGAGFERLNLACPAWVLQKALEKLEAVVRRLGK